jgi:hypothetical protein
MLLEGTKLQTKRLSADEVLMYIKLAELGILVQNSTLKNIRSCGFELQKACCKGDLQ